MTRKPWLRLGLAVSCLAVLMAGIALAATRDTGTPKRASPTPPPTPGSAPAAAAAPAPSTGPAAGTEPAPTARIAVAVATLWVAPGMARPIDAPSLTNPVDIGRWVATMRLADKQWLVGKLATQALYGDTVGVQETRGAWTKVTVADQPSSQDSGGYPGWLPTVQLVFGATSNTARRALVTKPTVALRDPAAPDHTLLTLSYNTRLPVLAVGRTWTTVATPEGGSAVVASGEVTMIEAGAPPPSGTDLVRTAQMFSGLPYLWAGTSGFGFDCSGFTSTVYGALGIVLPRDADDQAAAGSPVAPSALQAGDLLFYAGAGGRGVIHHVALYIGAGLMIQSPATGKAVETVPVNIHGEFWGARRYLPEAAGP